MLIIHGDNPIGSRELLNQRISHHKSTGIKDIVRIDGKKTTPNKIIQSLESKSLFGTERLTIIENIITRPKSKTKNQIINYLKNQNQQNLIIWEPKKLTKTQTNKFEKAQVKEFKNPSTIFAFLDSIGDKKEKIFTNYQEALKQNTPQSIFYMLSRQTRLLLQTSDPEFKAPSWQKNKLISQLKKITLKKVLWLHEQLLKIDENIKTGNSPLGLQSELELLLSKL